MAIRAKKFTPEVLLSAPRRSEGLPNSDASKVLYSVSTYSFDDHSKKSEIRIIDSKTQESSLVTDKKGYSEPQWLDDDNVVMLHEGDGGVTHLEVGPVQNFGDSYAAGTIDGSVGNLKLVKIGNFTYGVALTGKADPNGDLVNSEKGAKSYTSGRVYDSLFVRHWDHYVSENRNAIFLGTLYEEAGKFKLSALKNVLKGTNLESPIDPFGGTDNFDISKHGLVFTAKDPELNPATHTKTNVYLSASENFWLDIVTKVPEFYQIPIDGFEGASTSPVWDKSGKSIAFLSMKTDGYESDKNQIFVVPSYISPGWVIHLFAGASGKGIWDRSPQSVTWGGNDTLYLTAEQEGRVNVYTCGSTPLQGNSFNPVPTLLVKGGSVNSVQVLDSGEIFLSSTSLIENSLYSIVPADHKEITRSGQFGFTLPTDDRPDDAVSDELTTRYISSNTRSGGMFGLSRNQISETIWTGADKDTTVHAFVFKPSFFKQGERYPLAYLIHGGPQGAWTDSWSTRWNPAVFAEQGYIVVTPNPTGSTGYGQAFVDAIQNQWGGLPYEDLVLGFEHIQKNLSFVDTDRAVALGASYGGYMMNWIQGHDLGRKFKALVTHDGVFSMTSQLASEELYFPFHDLGGPLWSNRSSWEKWDPSRFADKWATPHLIIHSELDYRLTMNEGLSAFNVLQTKGVESQFLTFPDENHWVLKPENSLKWHEVVLDWINSHVGLPKYTWSRIERPDIQPVVE